MRLLLLTDGMFPYVLGGMQKHSSILAKKLSEKGVEVTVVHCGGDNYSKESFRKEFGDTINEILVPFVDNSKLPGHYLRATKNYAQLISASVDLANYDLIYAQGFTANSILDIKKRPPILLNLHGLGMFQSQSGLRYKIAANFLQKMAISNIRRADYVYSFGAKLDQYLLDVGCKKEKIIYQINGVTESWLSKKEVPERKCHRFIYIGRYERCKGIEEFYQAIDLIDLNDIRIDFIGPFLETQQKASKSIVYHGVITDEKEIQTLLDESDCLVCPSLEEGMPTVIAEAMARGCAIIATDVGAVAKQFENNGRLLENSNPEGIAKAITELSKMDKKSFHQLKLNSLEKVKKEFLWESIVTKKINDFEKILAKA